MNEQLIGVKLAELAAVYMKRLDKVTLAAYVENLRDLQDEQAFKHAIADVIAAERYFPSVAVIRNAYRACREQKPKHPELDEPELTNAQKQYNLGQIKQLQRRVSAGLKAP